LKLFKLSLIIFLGLFGILFINFDSKFDLEEDLVIDIKKGMSMHDISNLLKSNNLLYSTFLLNQYSKFLGKSTQIKTGEYQVTKNDSILKLMDKLSKGEVYYRSVRFKEGITFYELIEELSKLEGIVNDLGSNPRLLIKKLTGSKYSTLEGIFSPDTFFYKKGDSISNLLIRAYEQQEKELNVLWKNRMLGLPYKSIEQVLTMASIIEKEGIEKKRIAGVFINRLNAKMRLQSDPTVIYSLGNNFDGNIKKNDLAFKHPYNTYVIKGLPPGPISLVTLDSIKAALQPELSNYFYFVSRGDGTHQFSATLEEHNQAVRQYQLLK
tara:strand:- start:846 stop:1814 length:969 start_codon:yes stop_codon:yes gene_type:complete